MATLAARNPTLMDVAKLIEPNGGMTTDVVEMLMQSNPILTDATVLEANGGTYHRSSIRTGIPEPTWRAFYQGVQPVKSTYAQVDEPIGMMEARSQVDKDLADMSTNVAQFRLLEAAGIIEGMNQSMCDALLYAASSTSPEKFNGFMPRFSSLSAASGENIVDAGGTGSDNTSILFVSWSPRSVFLTYPKGTAAGLAREDLGVNHQADPPDGTAGKFSAYEERFTWKAGLVVRDWRHVVRIANIDVSNLTSQTGAADLIENMIVAWGKLPDMARSNLVIYANRTVETMLWIQARKVGNVNLAVNNPEGQAMLRFNGRPIRVVDQIANDETRVV